MVIHRHGVCWRSLSAWSNTLLRSIDRYGNGAAGHFLKHTELFFGVGVERAANNSDPA